MREVTFSLIVVAVIGSVLGIAAHRITTVPLATISTALAKAHGST